jgi:hypothetical protein
MPKMYLKPIKFVVALLIVLAALYANRVQAGSWAVIIFEDLPDHFVVGQPVTLSFSFRR